METALRRLAAEIDSAKRQCEAPAEILQTVINPGMLRLIEGFVQERLSDCIDVTYDQALARDLVSAEEATFLLRYNNSDRAYVSDGAYVSDTLTCSGARFG